MSTLIEKEWTAPEHVRLPDFIICGAMKSGTSTVHALLNKHPDVFIPEHEINFFDIDDIFQHSDFYFQDGKGWHYPDISSNPAAYWKWYSNFFSDAPQNSLIGEDSTCYLPSAKAAYRIALQAKPIKTIICLRQPTKRAYSQYWHMLRSGRALFNFDDTIKFTPNYVIERSMYLNQVRQFMTHIPQERIFFFILEEFLADKEATIKKLANFLALDYNAFPEGALETHENKATLPRIVNLQAFKNRILRGFGNKQYESKLPFPTNPTGRVPIFLKLINKLHNLINPSIPRPTPPMNASTKRFLDEFFQREMKGLGEITGSNIDKIWFGKETKQ